MKKLFAIFLVLFLAVGCDNNTETLSCSSTTTNNGIVTTTSYNFEYMDDQVRNVTITYDYSQSNQDDVDGVDVDTDGLTDDGNNDNTRDADDVVDGVVGDTIDTTVGEVADTILDIAGIKNTYENQLTTYDNIEGFSYEVDVDNDNAYRITYEIDMNKISDTDLATFDVPRDFSGLQDNYEGLGFTCK